MNLATAGGQARRSAVGVFLAYLLGRSYVGVRRGRARLRWPVCTPPEQTSRQSVVAVGNLGVGAAAALEPGLFGDAVQLSRSLRSWSSWSTTT